ncbi:MAG: hypothetical protein ACI9F9_003303, partial [Candidatus Paceibacteria bacterium]
MKLSPAMPKLPSAPEPATERMLLLCMWLCVGCSALTRASLPGSERWLQLSQLAVTLLLPGLIRFLARRFTVIGEWNSKLPMLGPVLQVSLLAWIPASGLADRVMLICAWLAVQFGLRRRSPAAGLLLVVLTPITALAAMAGSPGPSWLVLFPICVGAAVLALLMVSEQHHRVRVRRRNAGQRDDSSAPDDRALKHLPGQWGPGLKLWISMLAGTAVAYPLLVALPRPSFNPSSPSLYSGSGQNNDSVESSANLAGNGTFPGSIRPGGSLGGDGTALSYETLMTIQAMSLASGGVAGDVGPIYLGALRLDRFTQTALRSKTKPSYEALEDNHDGTQDGWISLGAADRTPIHELSIRHNILQVAGSGEAVLFIPQATLAIDLLAVRHDPDVLTALPVRSRLGEVSFRARVGASTLELPSAVPLEAHHSDPRFLQLPTRDQDLVEVENLAQRWRGNSNGDRETVAAIVDRLRTEFTYSTKTRDVPGTRGIVNFLRRKRGHCTSFAASAVLLLRTLGIPARVVTGFLADEYDPAQGLYLVSRS